MTALILVTCAALWIWFGYLLWKWVLVRHIRKPIALWIATGLFASAWLLGPWLDEYLGEKEFTSLCSSMPELQFLGPISIGEGAFFNAQGRPQWTNKDEFRSLRNGGAVYVPGKGNVSRWDQTFIRTTQPYRIADWPIPVVEEKVNYHYVRTGQPVLVSYWRGSPGGWLKRLTGWGNHSPYQCGKRTPFPQDEQWIKF